MRTYPGHPVYFLVVAPLVFAAAPGPATATGFSEVTITVNAGAGGKTEQDQANSLPAHLAVSAHDTASAEPQGGYFCFAEGTGMASVVGSDRMIIADMSVDGGAQGNQRCFNLGWGPLGSSATTSVAATSGEPVYFTSGFSAAGGMGGAPDLFQETELPRSAEGMFTHDLSAQATNIQQYGYSGAAIGVWSVGRAGLEELPYVSFPSTNDQQFAAPTPGTSVEERGLRYFAPTVNPNYLIEGFDLAGADGNPFTAFRFPDVPAGSDNRFTLTAGSSVIAGLAGQTVDLRQFAPAGFTALSVRGNLWAFHPAPGTDSPLGGVPLAFGATFARTGIAEFTLTPVPEPSAGLLLVLGLAVVAGHRRLRNLGAV